MATTCQLSTVSWVQTAQDLNAYKTIQFITNTDTNTSTDELP